MNDLHDMAYNDVTPKVHGELQIIVGQQVTKSVAWYACDQVRLAIQASLHTRLNSGLRYYVKDEMHERLG